MKNKLHFPFEVNMTNKNKEAKLIETHGPKGFGTYIMILTELRQSVKYQCSMEAVKGMARRFKISTQILKGVLYDFGLFDISLEEDGTENISSPYINRVMKAYEDRLDKLSKAGKKNADNSKRDASGKFAIKDGALDKDKDNDKDKTTTSTTKVVEKKEQEQEMVFSSDINAGNELKSWETYLDIATRDEHWMSILAMKSGISKLFVKHRTAVIESFRQHVQLQGSGSSQQSVADIQAYFANFLRPGTPTHQRVAEQLRALEEGVRQTSLNRYETIDPQTGARSYYGHPIPASAPPRPNDNTVWSPTESKWI